MKTSSGLKDQLQFDATELRMDAEDAIRLLRQGDEAEQAKAREIIRGLARHASRMVQFTKATNLLGYAFPETVMELFAESGEAPFGTAADVEQVRQLMHASNPF